MDDTASASPAFPVRGYIEGYYGRLLDWRDRHRLVDRLSETGMNAYCYAPKEDPFHRVEWRTPWPESWIDEFTAFCSHAKKRKINVIGGIAPGLDYNSEKEEADFSCLLAKARSLTAAGATGIALMFDDIEATAEDVETMQAEMAFHADVAARLSEQIDVPTFFVPRIYADEISSLAAPAYETLSKALPHDMPVFHCGSHIVAGAEPLSPGTTSAPGTFRQRLILWDNFFCNDYCPRRLFIGPHEGRGSVSELMLNGTGMIETDLLLLDVMAAGEDRQAWQKALADNAIPEEIHQIADWCRAPVLSDRPVTTKPTASDATFTAIETLLWRWKTPLSREWYPFIFGLKHDLLMAGGQLPPLRIVKTQTQALSGMLAPEDADGDADGDGDGHGGEDEDGKDHSK